MSHSRPTEDIQTETRVPGRLLARPLCSAFMRIRPKTIKDRRAVREAVEVVQLQAAMLSVGEAPVPSQQIASWSQPERNAVMDYLAAVHFIASDNPGKVPPRPACLGLPNTPAEARRDQDL